MDWIYRGFETSLLGLGLCLGVAALVVMGSPREPAGALAAGPLSVTLPMLSVTAPAAE